jgi:hypothetical protein
MFAPGSVIPEVSMDGGPPADDENRWVPRNDADRSVVPDEPILRTEQLCPRRDLNPHAR